MNDPVDMPSIQKIKTGMPTREAAEEAASTGCAILFNDPAHLTNGSVQRVLFATLVGDALLNFSDGVFIATAFQICSPAAGWVVVIGTVAKELAQELADFLVLATVCGLTPAVALALNFVTGITVTLGVIVVLAAGLSERAVGLLLAFGSGLYLHNAAVEYMPRLVGEPDLRTKSISAALFTFGAVAIGLVLLGQTDCEAHL